MKHVWRTDEDGDIDIFALDSGYHNGPACTVCKEYFCKHCEQGRGFSYEELLNRDDCEGE